MTPEKKRQVKDALYEEFARIGKAASSPRRLELLDLLSQGEKSVETLAEQADLTVKNTSAQLKVLRGARLVETRKSGQRVFYRLANQEVFRFWMALQTLGEAQYAELRDISERYYSDPDGLVSIDRETLVNRVRRGDVVVIDVRPEDEYLAGHLPNARSVPIAELTKRLEALPKEKEIVAYCRGRYCVYAIDAVAVLRKNGFRAHRFEESVQQWSEAGRPVERGSSEVIPAAAGGAK
jgi:rhodanese-related sulfurtransferase